MPYDKITMSMSKVEYRREFFDREYPAWDAYKRVWKYIRKYKFRIFVGIVAGMLTAGTLVPFFQMVQPALQHVETHDNANAGTATGLDVRDSANDRGNAAASTTHRHTNTFDKKIDRYSKLPSWYPTVEKWAAKCGISLQTEKGGMGGALVLITCLVVPLVAFVRLGLLFLNNYCLAWAGSHAVADLRQELLMHVQKQNLQFFGRVDMGQLLMRIVSDPLTIQTIMTTILTEVALAPFEIIVAIGYIIWFAVTNHMMPTLCLILIGFPLFVLPVQMVGRKVKKWVRKSMERNSMIGAKVSYVHTGGEELQHGRSRERQIRSHEQVSAEINDARATYRADGASNSGDRGHPTHMRVPGVVLHHGRQGFGRGADACAVARHLQTGQGAIKAAGTAGDLPRFTCPNIFRP